MKLSERIAALLKTREEKVATLSKLTDDAEAEGRVMNADEQKAFDECEASVVEIDENVTRLRKLEATLARGAQHVAGPRIEIIDRPKLEKGIRFARYVQAIAFSKGNMPQAVEIAKQQWPDTPEIADILRAQSFGITRAAVAAGTTTDATWASALAAAQNVSGELIELVRAQAVLGRMTGVRRVPFNVRIARETVALGTGTWVGQGGSKPVGRASYDLITIPFTKAALIVVITEELARFSNPAAENLMRSSLVKSITEFLDDQFLDSAIPAVVNVNPGGIMNGLPAGQILTSSGDTLQHMQYDIQAAVALLNDTNAPTSPVWIMHPQKLVALQGATNAFGAPAFPSSIGAAPTVAGYPVLTCARLAINQVYLMDQEAVLLASDDGVTVDVSREASVQMDSAPATPATPLVSFWQQNLIGLRAEQFIYWLRARDLSFVRIDGVTWGTIPPALALAAAPSAPAARATTSKASAS